MVGNKEDINYMMKIRRKGKRKEEEEDEEKE